MGEFCGYYIRGVPCDEADFIKWLESQGGEVATQPVVGVYKDGPLKGKTRLMSQILRVKNGLVVSEDS